MSYVSHIESAYGAISITDGTASTLAAGDFPQVHYDLPRIAREVDRDAIASGPSSLWRYAALLPVEDVDNAVTLGEGWTPLLATPCLGEELGVRKLWVKDEGRNPSGTFKDRGASVAITRARELGITRVIHNSSGNAAGSWAMYAARAGLECINLVPDDVLPASLQQSTLSGAPTFVLDGPWHSAGAMVVSWAKEHDAFNIGTLKEPHRLEGKKTMGLELAEQFGWRMPDVIVYPTGGGLGAIGIYKGLRELQALGWLAAGPLPKLVVTQYEGCAPLVKAFEEGATHAQPWTELDVPPGGLKSTRPPGDRAVLDLLRDTGGTAVAVSSADAISAATSMVRAEGLFPCPEAGTTVVGLREAMRRGIVSKDDSVVLMMTGNGLKSTQVLADGAVRRVAAGSGMPGV